jgi:hypothetical protein
LKLVVVVVLVVPTVIVDIFIGFLADIPFGAIIISVGPKQEPTTIQCTEATIYYTFFYSLVNAYKNNNGTNSEHEYLIFITFLEFVLKY